MRRFYNFLQNMVRKRPSPESNKYDEQTNEASDSVFQQDDNAKRVKLSTLCGTTLQDLPMELIEYILVKAVAMEVKGMKLAKSVWKEKADLVISRLRTVCPQWNNILTTNFFRNELHRTLDRTGQIRMEILHQSPFLSNVRRLTTLKDEIFILCFPENDKSLDSYYTIHVYDRNNMAEVKEVFPLPERIPGMGLWPQGFAACRMSNSVYVLCRETLDHISFLRITRDDQRQFSFSPMINHQWMPDPTLSVAANGSLILLRKERSDPLPVICMYNANGSVQHEIRLSLDITNFWELFPKSNGNFVFVSYNDQWQTKLMEVDINGAILRQYQSSLCAHDVVCHADIHGRILLSDYDQLNKIELLDSEFNLLDFTCLQLDEGKVFAPCILHYNGERNEVVAIVDDALTIFHFTEE